MIKNLDNIVNNLFQKNSLNQLTEEELLNFQEKYPYSSVANYLFIKKLKQSSETGYKQKLSHTSLFFNNKLWLNHILHEDEKVNHVSILNQPEQRVEETMTSGSTDIPAKGDHQDSSELSFEPYHTIDYFASQGIKLSQVENSDKLGQKVKSFTAWLKTMKKLQAEGQTDQSSLQKEFTSKEEAFQDNSPKDINSVITESMAEVYVKQGLIQKAIEIYNKLSLQNPDNSHIFADRIKALKENRP